VFGSAYDLILELGAQIDKIVAVPGDTDDKVAVFRGIFLRFL
jgi:hypothetical protein